MARCPSVRLLAQTSKCYYCYSYARILLKLEPMDQYGISIFRCALFWN